LSHIQLFNDEPPVAPFVDECDGHSVQAVKEVERVFGLYVFAGHEVHVDELI
jgi:hypothetical protein